MLALIAKLDGSHACLFHVEQLNQTRSIWQYRIRWPLSAVEALRYWQTERTIETRTKFVALADPTVPVEVEWRQTRNAAASKWGKWTAAQPHECVETTAMFRVVVRQPRDFRREDRTLRVIALVRGDLTVFDLEMPARALAGEAPETLEGVAGRSYLFGPGHHLEAPADFQVADAAYLVMNTSASAAAFQRVPVARPGMNPHRSVMFAKAGRLTDDELNQLMANG